MYVSGGQAKTLMFVHMSPEPDALGETLSTLKFAERVSSVELGAARVNKDNTEVKDLKEQVLTKWNYNSVIGTLCIFKLRNFCAALF